MSGHPKTTVVQHIQKNIEMNYYYRERKKRYKPVYSYTSTVIQSDVIITIVHIYVYTNNNELAHE